MARSHRAVPLRDPAPGSYYGLTCDKCGVFLPLYASNAGAASMSFDAGSLLDVECVACGHDGRYSATALIRANLPADVQ